MLHDTLHHEPLTIDLVLKSLQSALRSRDAYTAGHNERVCVYAVNLAKSLGVSKQKLEEVRIGAILHDVGKIGIDDKLLKKPSSLTPAEFAEMKTHSLLGSEICEPLGLSDTVMSIIRSHHERLDGSGYPDGLKGSQIPIEVQVVCVTDVADALLSNRVYHKKMEMEQVWSILQEEAERGLHDVAVVDECIKLMASGQLAASLDKIHRASCSPRKIATSTAAEYL